MKKHYRIGAIVTQEDLDRFGEQEIVRGLTQGAPYHWTFSHKIKDQPYQGVYAFFFDRYTEEEEQKPE